MNRAPLRGRPWTASDRTGGPLDQILDELRAQVPSLIVERLKMPHPGDDDNVYFIGDSSGLDRVQLDTAPGGQPSFLLEADQRLETTDPTHAATTIRGWLTS
jgi:hypothetical protein